MRQTTHALLRKHSHPFQFKFQRVIQPPFKFHEKKKLELVTYPKIQDQIVSAYFYV